MRRVSLLTACSVGLSLAPHAQGDGGYKLVPNWPKLPAGMYFGLKDAPPPPAERDAQAAARRASGGGRRGAAAAEREHRRARPTSRASPASPSISTITSTCSTAA